ncbi:C39 family peptidase [Sporolactobacillus shoreicorticis]|uniref:C39 family peptidase n=1 Tax=Sporolactobacillus shoreicorticis TaxID=1923877 RepID=A0ABW5S4D7_9BACL|nr:C39 family peptidase [Sporolactobacillus shoreicorticis]MCO7128128.1 C39 family peptidase [Sporolactobacillus shoreicorticis]
MRFVKRIVAILMVLIIIVCAAFMIVLFQNRDSQEGNYEQLQREQTNDSIPMKKKTLPKREKEPELTEKKLSAPYVSQRPELPNGCEVTSLTMLLQSAGVRTNKMLLAEQIKKVPFQSGKWKGNPNEGFVGNMYHGSRANPGLAVYHGPIADLARRYLGGHVVDMTGRPWSAIEKQIALGKPVWTITSINFQPVPASAWQNWPTKQGMIRITFKEHSVLLTGFDKKYVYFNDPLAGGPGSSSDKQAFIKAWHQFGNQALSYTSQ